MKLPIERRKLAADHSPHTDLPSDFLKLVNETLLQSFQESLLHFKKTYPDVHFESGGQLFSDEVILQVTLNFGLKNLAATTFYASADFDPQHETLTLDKVLPLCLDAIGTLLEFYLNPKEVELMNKLAEPNISVLDEAPFVWTKLHDNHSHSLWLRMDKANPKLEQATQDWLKANDPQFEQSPTLQNHDHEAESFLEDRLDALQGDALQGKMKKPPKI